MKVLEARKGKESESRKIMNEGWEILKLLIPLQLLGTRHLLNLLRPYSPFHGLFILNTNIFS